MCGETGVAWSPVGRGGPKLHQIPELMGMKEMVPGRKRDWSQGFRSRDPWRGSGDAAWPCREGMSFGEGLGMLWPVGGSAQGCELVMDRGGEPDPKGLRVFARSWTLLFTPRGAAQPCRRPPLSQRSEGVKSSVPVQKSRLLSSDGVASKRNFFEGSAPGKAEPAAPRKVRRGRR